MRATVESVDEKQPCSIADGEFDVFVSATEGEVTPVVEELRAALPNAYFIVMHASRKGKDARWLSAGFDGFFSSDEPIDVSTSRIVAAARYARRVKNAVSAQRRAGSLTLDYATRAAMLNGQRLELTAYEFSILATLARNLGLVLTRQQLLEQAKGSADEAFDRSIDVQISRLRAKLGDDPRRPMLLKTVRGKGYVLVPGTL
ncbi:MAG: winged helix-turn-helix domain-containing protein [Polyangiaceae bacterium]